jgi:ubiquinone/menaquinone biosynthesis C-methylase UbiE
VSHEDRTRERFAATADRLAALGADRVESTRERIRRFAGPRGDESALDAGTGTGTLALALAPLVRSVVGIDLVPEMLEHARAAAAGLTGVTFVEGDVTALPFPEASFDLVTTARTLHHVSWPDIALSEMTRVTRVGGRLLVVDQIASADPLEGIAHNRIEQLRDPSHVRVLSDQDFRTLFDANDLLLRRSEVERDRLELDRFLDLAACEGDDRAAVYAEVERLLSIGQTAGIELRRTTEGYGITLSIAWYLLERVPPPPPTTAI